MFKLHNVGKSVLPWIVDTMLNNASALQFLTCDYLFMNACWESGLAPAYVALATGDV